MSTPRQPWGHRWRSSQWFTVMAMATALFTDTFLYSFLVPILPYVIEDRLGLKTSSTQTITFWLLAESAGISVVASPIFGHFADKSGSNRAWLLWGLAIVLTSTVFVALATSLAQLFLARLWQAIASSIIWVVGLSTVADTVHTEHMGKTFGLISLAVALGSSVGPMLSGVVFELAGYWAAWSTAFVIIGIDIALRLLMLERRSGVRSGHTNGPAAEQASLLSNQDNRAIPATEERTGLSFYTCILSKSNLLGGMYCNFIFGLLLTAFDATLPLHVREVFHWGSVPAGLMFGALQAPGIVMAPIIGWLKDRVGTRDPAVFAFTLLAPLFWLLGIAGTDLFPWAKQWGSVLYVLCMVSIGIISTFLNGSGTIEATLTVEQLEKEHPGLFGPHGGTFVGPILAGGLRDQFGYYVLNCVVGWLRKC
ncbi:hypothetical protein Asppvi_009337 [Aspergillus pseudoviridinutans]|uniref:Major facilitator superfamily (MFS) profile domain-containing protein n=1 Tax=Aspergillus pseudoviridinutans TaxID=1517512 RepID=A0A9P3EYV7_9EURO|nr:uncharacterized protein Asppvi_009337 [Aspergillus pseudoviridinutans]GIJ90383.1 hypothetical protein Asppvi_009337 [Aspergillus pseudoviridinutans]